MAFNHELVAECLQFEEAFCTAACPFNFDVRDFIGKLQQGRFNIAYKTYQYATGFPGTVSALCPEYCKGVCAMKDAGGSISLRDLERASILYAQSTLPDQYNMPQKNKHIAIIGAGVSGLACALRLTTRKYQVTVFEKSDRIGGHLHKISIPEMFLRDFDLQFKFEKYDLRLNSEITSLNEMDSDAIYIATGKDGNSFGLDSDPKGSFATTQSGVFIGGSVKGSDTMTAIAHGLNVSNAIETWLKIGSMSHQYSPVTTRLTYDAIRIPATEEVVPSDGKFYSKEEAVKESNRCLKCRCDACNFYSPLMSYFKKFPRRITEEVQITLHPSSLDGNARVSTRYISTCTHCGLCKEVCPKDIDTGKFLLQSHQTMRNQWTMPWAFHEFYLRDMDFSIHEAGLVKLPQGHSKSRYMFFPGCQLGASDPQYVQKSYRFLLNHYPDTSLYLGCCGAPAEWAGDEKIHSDVISQIVKEWKKLGEPIALFACPTCKKMFEEHLQQIKGEFIYPMMLDKGILSCGNNSKIASVFDPCSTRNEPDLQQTIRKIAAGAGFQLSPLPMEGRMAECCSHGGQVAITHPPYADNMIRKRIGQRNNPYITYCSNCRDIFAAAGKETWHILDIIFDINIEEKKQIGVSVRQKNRLYLKKQLLKEFWNEEYDMERTENKLAISGELKEKLSKSYILETDMLAVIEHCEESGNKLCDPEKNTFAGYQQIGNMTYWVEYKVLGEKSFELLNGYCHRMKIEG